MIVKTTSIVLVLLVLASVFSFFFSGSITGMVTNPVSASNAGNNAVSSIMLGEMFMHYSVDKNIDGLNKFQESVKLFSKEVFFDCFSSSDKALCVSQKMSNANVFNLVVDDCKSSYNVAPVDFIKLKSESISYVDNKKVKVGGSIEHIEKDSGGTSGLVVKYLTLKQSDGSLIDVSFKFPDKSLDLTFSYLDFMKIVASSHGSYIEINGFVYETNKHLTFAISGKESDKNFFGNVVFLDYDNYEVEYLNDLVVSISDCALSSDVKCLCKTKIPLSGKLVFFDKEVSFKDYSAILPVNFFGMDMNVKSSISKYVDYSNNPGLDILNKYSSLLRLSSSSTTQVVEIPDNLVEVNIEFTKVQKTTYILSQYSNEVVFKKDFSGGARDFIVVSDTYDFRNNVEGLNECVIKERHFLFCASPLDVGVTGIQQDNPPTIKFSLRI